MAGLRHLLKQQERFGGRRHAPVRALELNTAPTNEVITQADAEARLRIDHANEGDIVDDMVKTARAWAEEWCNRSFLNTTWDYWLDEHDPALAGDVIELPRAPLSSITSIVSLGDDNSETTFTSTKYYAVTGSEPGRVALVSGQDWPTDLRDFASVRIRYVAGWGAAITNVPTQYREWIVSGVMDTVAALYEHRGDGKAPTGLTERSMDILRPLRIMSL